MGDKVCAFVIGTNCTGKTSAVKEVIRMLGGATTTDKWLTKVANIEWCFAGKYDEGRFGGVDRWGEIKPLATVVKKGLEQHDIIVCEGIKLHSTGPYLCEALFTAQAQVVFFLYAPNEIIYQRLQERCGGGASKAIFEDQKACVRALRRWAQMGVKTVAVDTSKASPQEVAEKIIETIKNLRNG